MTTATPASPAPTASPFRVRTDVLFASRAPVAVILRRGPRTHWQLILWDTRRDRFTPGQWMKGLVRLMDLSPRGDKLIYWAAQYHPSARWNRAPASAPGPYDPLSADHEEIRRQLARRRNRKPPRYLAHVEPSPPRPRDVQGVWTAISTPPYFTALAIWPSFGHWTGGGFFRNDRRIVLYEPECGLTPIVNTPIPITVSISPWDTAASLLPPPETLAVSPNRQITERQIAIDLALKAAGTRFLDWTCIGEEGDILFACDGAIYRHTGTPAMIDATLLSRSRKLIDLTQDRFSLLRAPTAAMRW